MAHVTTSVARELPAIAILPWGDVIEDFLDPLGLDARTYLKIASGGWLFGYVLALREAGWRPLIIWASREVSRPEQIIHPATGVSVWLVPGRSGRIDRYNARTTVRRWLQAPMRVIEGVLRSEGCRAILTQEYEDPRFDRMVALGRRCRIPVYATFQGGDRTASWLEEWIRPRSIARSAGLIIASQAELMRVKRKYAGRLPRVAIIPNPLQLDKWKKITRSEARQALGISEDTFLVFNHGRIDIYRKGLDTLVDAWMNFQARPNEKLVIIGAGQDTQRFQAMLDERKPPGLEWQGEYTVDSHLIRLWLSAADVYVTASRIEGMPVAPLEAMACGLPVVATDANGLSDILSTGPSSGGLIVAREDALSFAQAIRKLSDDAELRSSLADAALKRVGEHYSISKVSVDLREFLGAELSLRNVENGSVSGRW